MVSYSDQLYFLAVMAMIWIPGGVLMYVVDFVWATVFFRPVLRYGYIQSALPRHENVLFISLAAIVYPWSALHVLHHGRTDCVSQVIGYQQLSWEDLIRSVAYFPIVLIATICGWVRYFSTLLQLLSGRTGPWRYRSYQEIEPDPRMKYC